MGAGGHHAWITARNGYPLRYSSRSRRGSFRCTQQGVWHMEKEKGPYCLLVKKQTFEGYKLKDSSSPLEGPNMLHREEILERVAKEFPSEPLVTTTGFTSREMFELRVANKQSH